MQKTKTARAKQCLVVRVYGDGKRRVVSKMFAAHETAQRAWRFRRYGKTGLRYMAIFSPKDKRGVRWQVKRMVLDADGRLLKVS